MIEIIKGAVVAELKLLQTPTDSEYKRGHLCGLFIRTVRSSEEVALFARTFKPKNAFDRGFVAGVNTPWSQPVGMEE